MTIDYWHFYKLCTACSQFCHLIFSVTLTLSFPLVNSKGNILLFHVTLAFLLYWHFRHRSFSVSYLLTFDIDSLAFYVTLAFSVNRDLNIFKFYVCHLPHWQWRIFDILSYFDIFCHLTICYFNTFVILTLFVTVKFFMLLKFSVILNVTLTLSQNYFVFWILL